MLTSATEKQSQQYNIQQAEIKMIHSRILVNVLEQAHKKKGGGGHITTTRRPQWPKQFKSASFLYFNSEHKKCCVQLYTWQDHSSLLELSFSEELKTKQNQNTALLNCYGYPGFINSFKSLVRELMKWSLQDRKYFTLKQIRVQNNLAFPSNLQCNYC